LTPDFLERNIFWCTGQLDSQQNH